MTPSELSTLIPHYHTLRFIELSWDYSFNCNPRQVPIVKEGEFVQAKDGMVKLLLSDCSTVWKKAQEVEVVAKFAEY